MIADYEHLENFDMLREALMKALANREKTVKLELSVLGWLALVDEIQNRRPRNYSALLRDDTLDRLEASIEWLGAEIRHVIAAGPSDVSARFGGLK